MPDEGELTWSKLPPGSTRELSTRVVDTRAHPGPRRPLPPPPPRIGRFRPIEVLGRGGMGVVYRAEDPRLDRTVALKLLTPQRGGLEAQQRLSREAQALAQLSHPNVVQVFDRGIVDGRVYIAMELVSGRSLRSWVGDERPSLEAIVEAYVQAGTGLAAAHARGIVHRDFKPDNAIMGDDGRVRVLDFGLACADAAGESSPAADDVDSHTGTAPWPSMLDVPLTASGTVMGTPVYMAPELHEGRPATPASDQFALCVSLFEAIYGRRPFDGARLYELVDRMVRNDVGPEPEATHVPAWLRSAVLRGLRADPAQRWSSMDALLVELGHGSRRGSWRRGVPALGLALALGGGAVALALPSGERPCADPQSKLAGTWDDARQLAVRRSLERDRAPYAAATSRRVEAQLDAYAERWRDAYRLACTDARDDGALDLRMTCLQRRRQGLAALVDLLADPQQDVRVQAVSLVSELGDVGACSSGSAAGSSVLPGPRDAAQAREVAALREQLARIAAHQGAGHYEQAAREASQVVREAEALGYAPLIAEAALRDGVAHYKAGEPAVARPSLERAFFVAAELGYDEIAGEASAWLVFVVGVGQGDLDEATRWAAHALAASEGRNELTTARALSGLGMVQYEQGAGVEARELFERELAILERTLDPLDVRLASTLNRLGMVVAEQGAHEQALAYQERALVLWAQAVGPDHPKLASAYHYRALAFERQGDYERALLDGRRALAIWERALGPDHPEVGVALANLGVLLHAMDRTAEALEHYRRALAIWEAALEPEHPRVASLQLNIGYSLDDLDDRAGAIAAFRRAHALREQAFGSSHPQTVEAREALQEALAAQ